MAGATRRRSPRRCACASARPRLAAVLVAALLLLGGCATYVDRMQVASTAVSAGNYAAAVGELNSALGVRTAEELPSRWGSEGGLLMLERGVLQQALARFRNSARDLSAAEQELELLDISKDPVGTLGKYLYSESAHAYKTPPTERLALNALNMLNYLAVGDVEGAAVEARRFQVMREYLESGRIDAHGAGLPGAYLAGFVFEQRGEGDRALRYYDEVLAEKRLSSLDGPVQTLAASYSYRGSTLRDVVRPGAPKRAGNEGELLVVLNLGRVSHRVPERMPIGAAVGIAGTIVTGDLDWLRYGATKVIVYPELVPSPSLIGSAAVRVDGRTVTVEEIASFDAAVRREYEEMKPKIIAAAVTRLAARAAVAEGVRAAGKQQSALLGDLLSLAVEGAMVALDRPDTRSWTMLPARVLAARIPLSPGTHTVDVEVPGASVPVRSIPVDIRPKGATTVVVTEPR